MVILLGILGTIVAEVPLKNHSAFQKGRRQKAKYAIPNLSNSVLQNNCT